MDEKNEFELTKDKLESIVYDINGELVMFDFDIAKILGYTTKAFNQYITRHLNSFNDNDRFKITKDAILTIAQSQNVTAQMWATNEGGRTILPYVFTKNGVKVLVSIIKPKSETIKKNILLLSEYVTNNVNEQFEDKCLCEANNCELVKFEDGEFSLDVNVSPYEDTIWLTVNQMADLFETTRNNIIMHITNIYTENELDPIPTSKDYLQVQIEGNRKIKRLIKHYNFDMIISIGCRVKSKRGYEFRKWATNVLKQYLFTGSIINEKRCLACNSSIVEMNNKISIIENKITELEKTTYSKNESLYFEGEIVEAYSFIRKIFFLAKKELIIIDNYADNFLLSMLRDITTKITIYTSENSYIDDKECGNNITIIKTNSLHGRYIIPDNYVYLLDNSINNIGKKNLFVIRIYDFDKDSILGTTK